MSDVIAETIMTNPKSVVPGDNVEETNASVQKSDTFDPTKILVQVIQRPTDPLHEKLQNALYSWVAAGMAYQPVKDIFGGWIDVARNWQTKLFRKAAAFDHLLLIDSDVGPPVETPFMLRRHNQPVVSAVVCGFSKERGGTFICVALDAQDGRPRFISLKNHKTLPARGLLEVSRAGTGCLLIRRDVIESLWGKYEKDLADQDVAVATIQQLLEGDVSGHTKLEANQRLATQAFLKRFNFKTDLFGAPFNIPQAVRDRAAEIGAMPLGEDVLFSARVKDAGFKIYADLECRCQHQKIMTLAWPNDAVDDELSVDDFKTSLLDMPVEMTA